MGLKFMFVTQADTTMARRGWKRFVEVGESGQTVLIYLPMAEEQASPSRVCLAVCDRGELVIVAADLDAEPLAEFARREIGQPHLTAR